MKAPCKNCPERRIGCHSTCEAYLAYAEERAQIRAEREKHATSDGLMSPQKLKNINHARKRRN